MRKPPPLRVAADIASRVRELREVVGETQEAFASRFGRSWKQVSAWENRRQDPPPAVLVRAASAAGWPLEIFAEGGKRPRELVNAPLPPSATEGTAPALSPAPAVVNVAAGASGGGDPVKAAYQRGYDAGFDDGMAEATRRLQQAESLRSAVSELGRHRGSGAGRPPADAEQA